MGENLVVMTELRGSDYLAMSFKLSVIDDLAVGEEDVDVVISC